MTTHESHIISNADGSGTAMYHLPRCTHCFAEDEEAVKRLEEK